MTKTSACLDDKGLASNLPQVLVPQQLTRGQHDAAPRSVLPPVAAMQVQRLPCHAGGAEALVLAILVKPPAIGSMVMSSDGVAERS